MIPCGAVHAERIDHGMRAIDDAALVRRLADEQVALTMCPLSNRRLQMVQDVAELPIAELSKRGYSASAVVLSMKVAAALQAVVKAAPEKPCPAPGMASSSAFAYWSRARCE